jgi:hypothetical protein
MIPAVPISVRRQGTSHAIPKSGPSFVKDFPDLGTRSAVRRKPRTDTLRYGTNL